MYLFSKILNVFNTILYKFIQILKAVGSYIYTILYHKMQIIYKYEETFH